MEKESEGKSGGASKGKGGGRSGERPDPWSVKKIKRCTKRFRPAVGSSFRSLLSRSLIM